MINFSFMAKSFTYLGSNCNTSFFCHSPYLKFRVLFWGAALYVMVGLDCRELSTDDDVVERLWLRIKRQERKGNVTVGVYYKPPR